VRLSQRSAVSISVPACFCAFSKHGCNIPWPFAAWQVEAAKVQEELAANRFEVRRNIVIKHCAMLTAVDASRSALSISHGNRLI
jgi:hypothetical protein